jgi:uncharacterized protein (DUF3084 family)
MIRATYITGFLIVLFFAACNNDGEKKVSTDQLLTENNKLRNDIALRDRRIYRLVTTVNEVHRSLNQMDSLQNNIEVRTQNFENNKTQKEKILDDIKLFEDDLSGSYKKINELNNDLNRSNALAAEYKKMIAEMKLSLIEKSRQMDSLKSNIEALEKTVYDKELEITELEDSLTSNKNSLQVLNRELIEVSAEKEKAERVYVIIGSESDLRKKNVIKKRGGFLGIGSELVLLPDVPLEVFRHVDIDEAQRFRLQSDKTMILPERPNRLYSLNEKMLIIESERFWDYSRYLVLITD